MSSRSFASGALCSALMWMCTGETFANHTETDTCPDTHVDGSESMDGAVANYVTWEKYTDGMQVPLGTQLVGTGHATAFGHCDIFVPDGHGGCMPGSTPRRLRYPVGFNAPVRIQDRYGDTTSNGGTIFASYEEQDFDAYSQNKWTNWQSPAVPTIYTWRYRNVIDTTTCQVGDSMLWGSPVRIYALDENRCPIGDADSNAGNPCNAATGNKHQTEIDYSGPGTGLSFIRSYNSQIPIDFGLGQGWMSNLHKRLERFASSIRLRREHGGGDVFTDSSGVWTGPPDSAYTLIEDATGYTLAKRDDGSSERYDLNGKLLSETDSVGRTTSYTYNVDGRLLAVSGPWGHLMSFTYNADGRLQSMTDPALQATTYAYNVEGNLTTATYPDSSVRTYHYELPGYPFHALTGITDENGDRYATFAYDSTASAVSGGKAISTQHAQTSNGQPQEKFTLAYTSSTTTTVTDPNGTAEVLTFLTQHGMHKLVSRINQTDNKGTSQTYDSNNNLLTRTDPEGRVTKYTYNASNQMLTMTEAFGTADARITSYEYLSSTVNLVTKISTPSVASGQQREAVTNYNPNRTASSVVVNGFRPNGTPVTRTTSMLYNTLGQVTQIDGPRTDVTDVTTMEYYQCTTGFECGQLKKITNALGHVTTFDLYDAHGRLLQKTDENGLVTAYGYDLRGRKLSITEGSRATSFVYDDAGQLQTATTPDGKTLIYAYDAAHDLRTITDNAGNSISYAYDLKGNRTIEEIRDPTNALRKTVATTYDMRNRLDAINAAGSITDLLYDRVGNLQQTIDPNTNPTSHTYDPLNRIKTTTDALTGTSTYSYDVQNNLTLAQAANGAATSYIYDDLGNRLQQSSPDTGVTVYTYDAAGNRTSMTDARGILTNYTYDALNRLQNVVYPTVSLNRSFTYDAGATHQGRLTSWSDASGSTTQGYDLYGGLTSNTHLIGGKSFVTTYAYDGAGRLATTTYPSSGRTVTLTRNSLGQVTAVSTALGGITTVLANQFQYLPFGPPSQYTLGNGMILTRAYDQQYRVTGLQDTGAAPVRDQTYVYDAASNIDRIQDNLVAANTQDFVQDALNRITADSGNYGVVGYLYDSVGNRTQRTRGGVTEQTITYTSSSNRLNQLNSTAYTYDGGGNTLSDGPGNRSFSFDDTNRLTEIRVGGVLSGAYLYNANGQRVRKIEATGAQRSFYYHYGLSGELLAETIYSSSNQKLAEREYIWADSLPVAFAERTFDPLTGAVLTTQLDYLHVDHLGTPRIATDGAQRVVWRWSSDAFGIGTAENDPDGDTIETPIGLRFPGQYFDAESGLHYNYFRDYDAATGRYAQSDPIGLPGGINTYAYVADNPIIYSDAFGLCKKCGLAKAAEYDKQGTVPRGTLFSWTATFKNDADHDPKCCEVRQFLRWSRAPGNPDGLGPHRGFSEFPNDQPDRWHEDRDKNDWRYGYRTGPYANSTPNNRYSGNSYYGDDRPNSSNPIPGYHLMFQLRVLDVCNGYIAIHMSNVLTVDFGMPQ